MKRLKVLWTFMKGNRLLYLGAIISIGLAIVFRLISPLIIRLTIDSIIGDEPMNAPLYIINIINKLGGTEVLSRNLWICGILLVVTTALRGIFLFIKGKWSAKAGEMIAKNMRDKLYNHLQLTPYEYHVKAETGDLIQRCTSDVETIRRFLASQFVEIGRAIFMLTISLIIMFSINVKLTFVAMSIIPFIFSFAVIFFVKVRDTFKVVDESEAKVSTVLQENLTGVRVVRAFARQSYEIEKFDEKNLDYRNQHYKLMKLLALYWSSSDFLCLLQIGAVLILGVYWASTGVISLGTLYAFTIYEGMLLWPIRQMGRILSDMGQTTVSLDRIIEILDEKIEILEENGAKPEIQGNIEFKNVHFEYEKDRPILDDVSFNVKKGETIAILGPTGSGKSSLVHLLARLYDYKKGSIKIDGIEINEIDKKWIRQNIGIVLQEPFLFSKTIKENISLAKAEAEDHEVFESANIASIHDVILNFEKGYETPVGEQGVTLSGGQKQRVAIARTLINNCPILIFDDSLSAVDTETDSQIRKALKEKSNDVTTFIISHRVSTLAEADKIIVLEQGKITQEGKHNELIKRDGLYKRIWAIQNELEDELQKTV